VSENETRETITIAKVDRSRSDNGKASKIGVQDERNRWFGVFDQNLWPKLTEGASLNVAWIKGGAEGQYKNIVGILGTGRSESPNGAPSAAPNDREMRIMRECALKCAVDCYKSEVPGSPDGDEVHNILAVADVFFDWLSVVPDPIPF
jgi:hypothetical protein